MNLHRTTGKPDWASIEPASYTFAQKIAAFSKGIITPANIISIVGLALVFYGIALILEAHYWLGMFVIVAGRLLDIADGLVAEATKTKSPTGEIVDAVADKIGTFATIVVLFVVNVADWWTIAALLLPQVLIPLVIFYKRQRGIGVHPTRPGKLSMALVWVGIAGLLILKALGTPFALTIFVYVVTTLSLALGLYAFWQYATGRD